MVKGFLILAIALILFSLAGFVQASSYEIELNQVDGKVLAKHSINLDSEMTIPLSLPSDASSISSNLNYTLTGDTITIKGKDIEISYITQELLEKSAEGYYFVNNVEFSFPIDESSIALILKEGYFVEKEHIFPKPFSIETDGRQISIIWKFASVNEGDNLPFFVTIRTPSSAVQNVLLWIVVLAAIAVASYWVYKRYYKIGRIRAVKKARKSHKKEAGKFEDVERYLVESEKAVLNELKKADRGEMWQKQLQVSTGFSKAKLSRVIRNLESRNLVEKIPFGNTNKVRLK